MILIFLLPSFPLQWIFALWLCKSVSVKNITYIFKYCAFFLPVLQLSVLFQSV